MNWKLFHCPLSVLIYSNTSQTILPNVTEAESCDLLTSSGIKLMCFCLSSVLGAEPHQVCQPEGQRFRRDVSIGDENKSWVSLSPKRNSSLTPDDFMMFVIFLKPAVISVPDFLRNMMIFCIWFYVTHQ